MSESTAEKLEFKSELRQVLHLITHSLYSHKEIFLRELLSNASDAIDKLRFNSLTHQELLEGDRDWKVRLTPDKAAGTLTVSDNGVGMDRDAVIENLGTIARSGTRAFLESLKQADPSNRPGLIGQFGVGFYSAFMVADRVQVISRPAGSPQAVSWTSDGQGEFTVEPATRAGRGTDVILHLKEEEKEFLDDGRLRQIVKQFSDFIEHPIVMESAKEGEGEEVLNSRKAPWLRSKADVTEEEHKAFYRQISGDFEDPARTIHYAAEGAMDFRALLYVPRRRSFELQFGEAKTGPRLYINRVLIMDSCEALLPSWLRFVKGVVDCADLPLNVSREMLQHSPLLEKIQKSLVKNVLKALADFMQSDPDGYKAFFQELGAILKEGLGRDWEHREALADLLLFQSLRTPEGGHTTLAQYVEAMAEEQKDIFYLAGERRSVLEHAPSLEFFRHKGWDVLLLTDPIDEFVLPSLGEFKGKRLQAADRYTPEIPEEEKKKVEEASGAFRGLLDTLKGRLAGVREVRLSSRLKESAACLVSEEGALGPNLERLLQKMGRGDMVGQADERILELNPEHPAVRALQRIHQKDASDPRVEAYAHLLHDQALLAEGGRIQDPVALARRINELIAKDQA